MNTMKTTLPTRKRARLEHYDYSTAGAYFITICTQNREPLLAKIVGSVGGDGLAAARSRSGSDNTPVLSFKTLTPLRYLVDPKTELTPIGKIVEKYLLSSENMSRVHIDQYIIMPDHIHAIVVLQEKDASKEMVGSTRASTPTHQRLPRVVAAFKRLCSKELGKSIFQRGYYEHIIRDREDYEEHLRYIRDNPARWFYDELYRAE